MSSPNPPVNTEGQPMEPLQHFTTLTPCASPLGRGAPDSLNPSPPPATLPIVARRPTAPGAEPVATLSFAPETPERCEYFLALLSEFYESLPEPLTVCATFLPPESIPQPQRDLLVHYNDMTSTLSGFYGEPISLNVLHRHQGPQWYRRHIVLETANTKRPVEYGAMRILLPLLSEAARSEVLAARTPLGEILARQGLAFRHCPGGFFKLRSNHLIELSLALTSQQWLYGRCNCMSDSVGRVVAEVVEVLPPERKS
jgi:hypothetical protein